MIRIFDISWLKVVILIITSFVLINLSACQRFRGTPPTEVIVQIEASKLLNPDSKGRPSPLVIRLYYLKSSDAFNNAAFEDLFYNGKDILGADLLAVREINIFAGSKEIVPPADINYDSNHLGVVAAYRDIDNAIWRDSAEITLNDTTHLRLKLGQLSVKLEADD